MKIYCKKKSDDVFSQITWCKEFRLHDCEYVATNTSQESWERCVELVESNKCVIMGGQNCVFVLFTERSWNPYIIYTDNIDYVSEYLCKIKKRD